MEGVAGAGSWNLAQLLPAAPAGHTGEDLVSDSMHFGSRSVG